VLPVGGVKEKVLAARRAGLDTVILPRENEKDLDDVPAHLRKEMEFILVDDVSQVLKGAMDGGKPGARPRKIRAAGRKSARKANMNRKAARTGK